MTLSKLAIRLFVFLNVAIYRLTGGRVLGSFGGHPILLLTTRGRRSGKRRTRPMGFLRDGDAYVVVASAAGAPRHPAWYLNARDAGEAEIELRGERIPVVVEALPDGTRRDAYFAQFKSMNDAFERYEHKAQRTIPILVLNPRTERAG